MGTVSKLLSTTDNQLHLVASTCYATCDTAASINSFALTPSLCNELGLAIYSKQVLSKLSNTLLSTGVVAE